MFGLLFLSQGWVYAMPCSLLCLDMRVNNPQMTLSPAPFLLTCSAHFVLFAVFSIRLMQRQEVTEE